MKPYLISPHTAGVNTNVTQNQTFSISMGVNCSVGECGEVNESLVRGLPLKAASSTEKN